MDIELLIARTPILFFLEGITWGHPFREHRPWRLTLYRNLNPDNHWLQVRLLGAAGNRPAIGARITVETAAGRQTRQVGQAEGAARSQGHYRAYFGLGGEEEVDRVRVVWPDGSVEERRQVRSDQLLVIEQAEHQGRTSAGAPDD